MMTLDLATLLVRETEDAIYARGLLAAQAAGLNTTSWEPGDPTRSNYKYFAAVLGALEDVQVQYIAAGFLDWAQQKAEENNDTTWLVVLAKQVFNVDAVAATYAGTTVTLSNAGGGVYPIDAGDLTFKDTATGKTYHNTTGGTLASGPGTTLDVDVVADEPGADSSASPGEIDALVTTLLGVTVSNATAAVGLNAESAQSIVDRCRSKVGILSPNGPRDAYNFVALTPELTGTTGITRSRCIGDSTTGVVRQYLAGPSGAISGGDLALALAAILKWAAPLCITPSIASASNVVVPVTYELWVYNSVGKTSDEIKADVATALGALFATRPIGGDVIPPATGRLYQSLIESVIRGVYPNHTFRVALTLPAADVDLTLDAVTGEVATLGTITPTVTFVADP